MFCPPPLRNWYGRCREFGIFGQRKVEETVRGKIGADFGVYHAAGVDAYGGMVALVDGGNNRVLVECPDGRRVVIGQPDSEGGPCNGDDNVGTWRTPAPGQLCLQRLPDETNEAELWSHKAVAFAPDGSLLIGDSGNDRFVRYSNPCGPNPVELAVIRPGFPRGIKLTTWPAPAFGGAVFDANGNAYLADTGNGRGLRFPPGQTLPDLVYGQVDLEAYDATACLSADAAGAQATLCQPFAVAHDASSGRLYFADLGGPAGQHRVVVFEAASGRFLESWVVEGVPRPFTLAAITFDSGVLWLALEFPARTVVAVDGTGAPLGPVIGATEPAERGGHAWGDAHSGCAAAGYGLRLGWPSGVAVDGTRIYVSDESFSRVAKYSLTDLEPRSEGRPFLCAAPPARTLWRGPDFSLDRIVGEPAGVAAYQGQLIQPDSGRFLVQNDYRHQPLGAPATFSIESAGELQLAGHARMSIDSLGRLWTNNAFLQPQVWQLPLQPTSRPLGCEALRLVWDDTGRPVPNGTWSIAVSPRTGWAYLTGGARILRVRDVSPAAIARCELRVDQVLGQVARDANVCNRGGSPAADTLCDVTALAFDARGHLYAVDNAWECHGNNRVSVFAHEDLEAAPPGPVALAGRWFVTRRQDGDPTAPIECAISARDAGRPFSPVSVACSGIRCMIGNDGYRAVAGDEWRQVYLYEDIVASVKPGAVLHFPVGAVGQLAFDGSTLLLQDHTRQRTTWLADFESWLMGIDARQ